MKVKYTYWDYSMQIIFSLVGYIFGVWDLTALYFE